MMNKIIHHQICLSKRKKSRRQIKKTKNKRNRNKCLLLPRSRLKTKAFWNSRKSKSALYRKTAENQLLIMKVILRPQPPWLEDLEKKVTCLVNMHLEKIRYLNTLPSKTSSSRFQIWNKARNKNWHYIWS